MIQGNVTGSGSERIRVWKLLPAIAAVSILLVLWVCFVSSNIRISGETPLRFDPGTPAGVPGLQIQSPGQLQDGMFLVAARSLRDTNFAQTVVFLIDYDAGGAFGLIIDRPTPHTMAELWPEITGLEAHSVHFGGPVFPNRLLFLLRSSDTTEGMRRVLKGVYLGSDELVLKRIVAEGEEEFRVYAGYSGWAPGQLDNEVARGDWYIVPAETRFIFDPQPSEVWPELIQRVDIQVARLSQ